MSNLDLIRFKALIRKVYYIAENGSQEQKDRLLLGLSAAVIAGSRPDSEQVEHISETKG